MNKKPFAFSISRRAFAIGLAATGILLPRTPLTAGNATGETVIIKAGKDLKVIELFTSEGCWSCPPAEAKLKDVADDPGVLALAYHVDYWDYIGWKDPYADPLFTLRQRRYAEHLKARTVYTPQMVFQGAFHAPGSRPGEMERELRRIDKLERIDVGLNYAPSGEITLNLPAYEHAPESSIYMVTYDREKTSDVLRGENAGKTLTHRNVVRSLTQLGRWQGEATTLSVSVPDSIGPESGCAFLIQANLSGRILGAAAIDMPAGGI